MHAGGCTLPTLATAPQTALKLPALTSAPQLLIKGRQGPSSQPPVVLLMPPTLSYCPGLAPSIPQTGRLQSAHNNCQPPSVTIKECSGKVPGRGAGAGQAGSRGRGLRARRDPCSPALGLSSHSQAMPISHTCTQHTEALRYHLQPSGSFRRRACATRVGACRGTRAGGMRGTSECREGWSIPVASM
jgi:hypothetical protein